MRGAAILMLRTRPAELTIDRRLKPPNTQEYSVTRQLLILILLAAGICNVVGCAAKEKKEPVLGPIPANGFMVDMEYDHNSISYFNRLSKSHH